MSKVKKEKTFIFGDELIFGKPKKQRKGYYTKKVKGWITQFLKAVKDGKCPTEMAKLPILNNPTLNKERMSYYNAIKALKRRGQLPKVDVAIIEDDLWLIYEGK